MQIQTSLPVFLDAYRLNQKTGSFILIDPNTANTVAAGMVRKARPAIPSALQRNIVPGQNTISREQWEKRNGHQAAVIWLTGLSGSGKSSISKELIQQLFDLNCQVQQLDGDMVRSGLCHDLGFGSAARKENIRRVGECAKLFFDQGNIVVCTFILL